MHEFKSQLNRINDWILAQEFKSKKPDYDQLRDLLKKIELSCQEVHKESYNKGFQEGVNFHNL